MRKSCIRHAIFTAAVLAFLSVMGAPDGEAQNYIFNYGKKLANGKTCRVVFGETHFHAANGADARKARARAIAIEDWVSFVVFEYGKRWSKWSAADKRSMKCINDKDAGVWRCRAEAQPCL
jgi:hypothetical protein